MKEVAFPELKVVRVGQQQKIHSDILSISLDELARKNLAKGMYTVGQRTCVSVHCPLQTQYLMQFREVHCKNTWVTLTTF